MDKTDVMSGLEGLTWDDWTKWHSATEVQQIALAALELLKGQQDVEKSKNTVISGIEHCLKGAAGCQTQCPYSRYDNCKAELLTDALEMLRSKDNSPDTPKELK